MFAILVALALPGAAFANSRNGLPAGNSGAYQYVESIPTAHGARPDPTVSPRPGAGAIPGSTRRSLLSDGGTGRQAYSVAAASAPKVKRRTPHHRRRSKTARAAPAAGSTPPGGSIPSGTSRGTAVVQALIGGGAGGSALALILLIAIAAAAVALRLRRRPAAGSR